MRTNVITDLRYLFLILFHAFFFQGFSQTDTTELSQPRDTLLRIKNLVPNFTLHVDSVLQYQFLINKQSSQYYWILENAPAGLRLDKDNGLLTMKAHKSYFLSGKLKYDHEYKVSMRVQNLDDPSDKLDTAFSILFFNTEIIPSILKPSVTEMLTVDEGDTVSFTIQCINGSFPIEEISYTSNFPLSPLSQVFKCGDEFRWAVPFDFVRDEHKDGSRKLELSFIGINRFRQADTATIWFIVNDNINFPVQVVAFENLRKETSNYILQLKSSFREVDRKIKKTRKTRTAFDLTSASTALGGTIFSSLPNESQKTTGKILPSVGVALVPVKEATAPNNNFDQNTAALIRNNIKRLEYLLAENQLTGPRDPNILEKTNRLKEELKQVQIQLIDIPIGSDVKDSRELDEYFNNPKVNKKYRLKNK